MQIDKPLRNIYLRIENKIKAAVRLMLRCRAAGESHGETSAALIWMPAGSGGKTAPRHMNDMIKSHG